MGNKLESKEVIVTEVDWHSIQLKLGRHDFFETGGRTFVLYPLSVSARRTSETTSEQTYQHWKVHKRFSEFEKLNKLLGQNEPICSLTDWGSTKDRIAKMKQFIQTINKNNWPDDSWGAIKEFVLWSSISLPPPDDCTSDSEQSLNSMNAGPVHFESKSSFFDSRDSLQLTEDILHNRDLSGTWLTSKSNSKQATIIDGEVYLDPHSSSDSDKIEWIGGENIRLSESNIEGMYQPSSGEIVWESGEIWRRMNEPLSNLSKNSSSDFSSISSNPPVTGWSKSSMQQPSESWTEDMLGLLDDMSIEQKAPDS